MTVMILEISPHPEELHFLDSWEMTEDPPKNIAFGGVGDEGLRILQGFVASSSKARSLPIFFSRSLMCIQLREAKGSLPGYFGTAIGLKLSFGLGDCISSICR